MKVARPLGIVVTAGSALLVLTLPAPSLYAEELPPPTVEPAEGPNEQLRSTTEPKSPETTEHSSVTNTKTEHDTSTTNQHVQADEDSNGHLKAPQRKSCQDRQENIDVILGRMAERSQNQLNLFQTVTERVEAFITAKNLSVANVSTLTTVLQTDLTKANSDLMALKAADTINCNGTNPKSAIDTFTKDQHQLIADLQTYKTDLTNLITAARTAAGTTIGGKQS